MLFRSDDGEEEPDGEDTQDDEEEMREGGEKEWPAGDPGEVQKNGMSKDANRTSPSNRTPKNLRMATDKRKHTGDSSSLRASWTEMLSRAELLVPEVNHPTFDGAMRAAHTIDAMCKFRRDVLRRAWRQQETHDVIANMVNGTTPDFSKMTCDAATMLFNGASEAMRRAKPQSNFSASTRNMSFGKLQTPADINKANAEYYKTTH